MTQDLMWAASIARGPIGFGALPEDVTAALNLPSFFSNPYAILKQFWAQVQGRSWDQAFQSANARATSKNWVASDNPSKQDFITLMVSTAVNGKVAAEKNLGATASDNPSDTLARTLYVLAKARGISTPTATDVNQMKTNAKGNIEVLIPVLIVAVIAQAIALMVIAVALIYFASKVIDDILSKIECDRELMRLHAAYNKIVDDHIQNPNKPWTPDEVKARDDLLAAQQYVANGCTKPKKGPFEDPWPYVIGASVLGVATLGVVYHKQISDWFERRRARA